MNFKKVDSPGQKICAFDRGEDLLTRNFSIGSFLLVRAKKTGYAYVSISCLPELLFILDVVPAVFFLAEADIPVGKPLRHAKKTIDELSVSKSWEGFEIHGGTVYARKFENGVERYLKGVQNGIDAEPKFVASLPASQNPNRKAR